MNAGKAPINFVGVTRSRSSYTYCHTLPFWRSILDIFLISYFNPFSLFRKLTGQEIQVREIVSYRLNNGLIKGGHRIGDCTPTRDRGQSEVKRSRRNFEAGQAVKLGIGGQLNPFSHKKFTRSPSKLSFGTGSTRLRLLRGNGTSHAHNHDLCKGGAQDAAQMQPRERMQLHQPTHGTLLTHTSAPRPFFGFFFFFFFFFFF